jgi:hypothetical protein
MSIRLLLRLSGVKTICFSASASFTASFVLLTIGAVTLRRASRSEIPFAAIPIFFAIQQLIEGILWLALPAQSLSVHILTVGYLVFANILWPIYVPVAIWMIEPNQLHRKRLIVPLVAGALTTLFFIGALAMQSVSAAVIGSHIHYDFPHPHDKIAFAFYATATCLAPLLSSHKLVRWLGLTLIVSMIAAYIIYAAWFASIWCYFAALISAMIWLYLQRKGASRSAQSTKQRL